MAWLLIEQISAAATDGQRRQRQGLAATLAPLRLPASDPMQPWLADLKQANRVFTQMMQLEVQKAQGVPDPEAIDRQVAGRVAELKVVQQRMNDFMAQRKAQEKR